MAKSQDKKTTMILLIVLAVAVIGGGIWTYINLQDKGVVSEVPLEIDPLVGLSIDAVFKVKEEAIDNIGDFLETSASSSTIWSDFFQDPQFNRLKSMNIEIDIEGYNNNSYPFVIPSSTKELL